ncbi:MAG: hypothetical protein HZB43_04925 [candidate division Zixibacteria bacterium]|nr:hypothetical protein [candidate division Zixibacteria bacterium]
MNVSATGAGSPPGSTVKSPTRDGDVYILSHDSSFFSTNASVRDIESIGKKVAGDFLWVRRAGTELIIRDARTLAEAARLFEPIDGLEPEREALQAKQEQLGRDEAKLDDEEERLEDELEALENRGEDHVSDSARAALEHRRVELKAKMRTLKAGERELDAQERALDGRSDELERKAESAFRRLIDHAITNGLGRTVGRE